MNLRIASLALLSSLACSSRPNAAFVVPGVGNVRSSGSYGGDSRTRRSTAQPPSNVRVATGRSSTVLSAVGTDRDQKSAEFTRVPSTRTNDGVVTPATTGGGGTAERLGGGGSSTASSTSTALNEIIDSQREFEVWPKIRLIFINFKNSLGAFLEWPFQPAQRCFRLP